MKSSIRYASAIFLLAFLSVKVVGGKQRVPAQSEAQNQKQVLAFYYPWYGNPQISKHWVHWADVSQQAISNSTDYPVLGAYDSHDSKVIEQQCKWAKQAGITGFIASWWGPDDFTDQALPSLLTAAGRNNLKVTVYIERAGSPKPSTDTAFKDVLYLLQHYGSNPAWLRFQGKPVLFVYGRAIAQIGLDGWQSVRFETERQYPGGATFVGDQVSDRAARIFDGLHEYIYAGKLAGKSPAELRAEVEKDFSWSMAMEKDMALRCLTVIPGYDDHKLKDRTHPIRVPRYDGETYRRVWQEAITAHPDWILITSWNEWHEGSEIEPSREYGEHALKTTAEFSKRFLAR